MAGVWCRGVLERLAPRETQEFRFEERRLIPQCCPLVVKMLQQGVNGWFGDAAQLRDLTRPKQALCFVEFVEKLKTACVNRDCLRIFYAKLCPYICKLIIRRGLSIAPKLSSKYMKVKHSCIGLPQQAHN